MIVHDIVSRDNFFSMPSKLNCNSIYLFQFAHTHVVRI